MKKIVYPEKAYCNRKFLNSPEARGIRVLSEIVEPMARLEKNKVRSTVLFLGSSHLSAGDKNHPLIRYYWEAEELSFLMTRWALRLKPQDGHFVICTGGGPGIMEAANRGAGRAGGRSIGMNISLPQKQLLNPYLSPEVSFIFHYFFTRKFWLINKARAVVAFPGGFGTLDEIFETLTLLQTRKINRNSVTMVLYGEDFWKRIINFEELVKNRTIEPEDLKLFSFQSTPRGAFDHLRKKLSGFI